MQNDYSSKKFKKWLDTLQQESWQLELIVSGFVIFGLFQAIEPLKQWVDQMQIESQFSDVGGLISIFGIMLVLSLRLMLFNLIVHLVLRGLWIGAVGLRYYSGDIDFKELRYSERFNRYLKRKIGSFDKYIASLEDWCSVIFSLSFFLVFVFISFAIILGSLSILLISIIRNFEPTWYVQIPLSIFVLGYLMMLLLTLVDFIGQGILKKNKWVSKFYFPFYWVMSYLSLSFLYRPILYNFLDHKKGRRILFWLIPFYIAIGVFGNTHFKQSNFHTATNSSNPDFITTPYYLTNYSESEVSSRKIATYAIENIRVERSSMRLFLFHTSSLEDAVVQGEGSITPSTDDRGFKTINMPRINRTDTTNTDDFRKYMLQLNKDVTIAVDSVVVKSDFVASSLTNGRLGYEMYVDLKGLERGKHLVSVERKTIKNDSIVIDDLQKTPFWYYSE